MYCYAKLCSICLNDIYVVDHVRKINCDNVRLRGKLDLTSRNDTMLTWCQHQIQQSNKFCKQCLITHISLKKYTHQFINTPSKLFNIHHHKMKLTPTVSNHTTNNQPICSEMPITQVPSDLQVQMRRKRQNTTEMDTIAPKLYADETNNHENSTGSSQNTTNFSFESTYTDRPATYTSLLNLTEDELLKSNLSNTFLKTILGEYSKQLDLELIGDEVLTILENDQNEVFNESNNLNIFQSSMETLEDQITENIDVPPTYLNASPIFSEIDLILAPTNLNSTDFINTSETYNNFETHLDMNLTSYPNYSKTSESSTITTNSFTNKHITSDALDINCSTLNLTSITPFTAENISAEVSEVSNIDQNMGQCVNERSEVRYSKRDTFCRVLTDLESASRHTKTQIQFTVSSKNQSITYAIDKTSLIYECKYCEIRYRCLTDLLVHGKQHKMNSDFSENNYLAPDPKSPGQFVTFIVNHKLKFYKCKVCKKQFCDGKSLYRHMACHVSDKSFDCDICGKTFRISRYLSIHKNNHKKQRMFKCSECNKSFKAKETLHIHELQYHQDLKPFSCGICGKKFAVVQYFRVHTKRHTKEAGRVCYICGKVLKNEALCFKHITDKHSLKATTNSHDSHPCEVREDVIDVVENQHDVCDVYKESKDTSKVYTDLEVSNTSLRAQKFEFESKLNENNIEVHMRKKLCELCGQSFPTSRLLKLHVLKTCSNPVQKKNQLFPVSLTEQQVHECEVRCETVSKNLPHSSCKLTDEQRQMNECEVCGKSFPASRNLQSHMKLHGAKQFKCEYCNKEFYYKRVLSDHLLIHTGEKPHECNYCGKKFRMLGTLYKHVRTHTGEKPFKCEVCNRGFAQMSSLQVHMRIHTGEKPFKCENCGKSYAQSYIYRQHAKKCHII